ncbi:LysR family transcriptional regulator [Maritimibacter sp. 55A14]|uniref:LysR family transcriptional regulator n=1 Tax=Maritimibacter sp. 55A14 TaxID=2174844 RepID=UPI001304FBAE|nr:LysR family transcriptional regulator [Maritimibacter sp. 55A14]
MTEIRDLKMLVALSQYRHFSRSADACGISQPAFSARIRKMEDGFSIPLVRRGNQFMGFTREGEVVLKWARKLLADMDGMNQEIASLSDNLGGRLVIGVIPTTLPFAARVSANLRRLHPNLMVEILSLSTGQIKAQLNDYSIDAGMIYFRDAEPGMAERLYDESYVLIAPGELAPRSSGTATWSEAAALPLCLLTRDMRNRQLVDDIFARIERVPQVVMEANAFTATLAQVASGSAATIAPLSVAETFFTSDALVRLPLVEPEVTHAIGLSVKDQDPILPVIGALRVAVRASL